MDDDQETDREEEWVNNEEEDRVNNKEAELDNEDELLDDQDVVDPEFERLLAAFELMLNISKEERYNEEYRLDFPPWPQATVGMNKAASSSTTLNTRKLDEETENLTHEKVPTELKIAIMQARMDKKLTQSQLPQM